VWMMGLLAAPNRSWRWLSVKTKRILGGVGIF
jgi:hypothetical protein